MASFYEELHKHDSIGDESENAASRATVDKWIFRMLLVLIGVMPLIVLANVEQVLSPLISNVDVLSSGTKGELFTHFKALIVLIVTVIAGAMLLAKVFFMDGKIKKTRLNYVLGIFVLAIIVSTIFSPTISLALNGQYNRSDGAISWLCYIALLFIALNIEYPKNVVRYIMYTMVPFVYINLYIITMNFYDRDLLQKSWMQKLVSITLPEGANISADSTLVGTLNQWNYMSGMFAILCGMYLIWALIEKSWINLIVGVITSIAALSIMLMSLSTSGFVTISALFVLIIVMIFKTENKLRNFSLVLISLIIIAPIFHVLAEKNPRVWSESIGFIIKENPYVVKPTEVSKSPLDFNFEWTSKVSAAENKFELPVIPETGISAGTGRTYIWGKAIDLVKERPFLGYGMDTFMYNFPHYNIDARGQLRTENTIVDKPHNMYIGILYGVGIIGFAAFIGIILMTIVSIANHIFKRNISDVAVLMIGWTGFLLQAFFNDTLPGTAAPMWIIGGILLATMLKDNTSKV